ncbi:hypothetical protein BCR35DRAFT_319080 [Leucosporidium creatinivorum]|uniref:Peptide hydrolase n=1 Tax=Leucosporidium creatinivorum TaxID=106004 RepID=A0A1Y2ECK6_9BASI|nr:hypothetical protein BCR35DRAFT_319080 [Leucosporidium creatinivorum]
MPRYRIVGTPEMVETEQYLLKEIERIREEVVARMGDLHQIEIWHQIGSGEHLFDFMDKMVWKKYSSIGNVIVRLSDGTEASKANAILVSAHTDSTLPSPGAADDLVGVATMLESLRVMGLTERRLTNSVVFLFNGGEESLQDASHLFITQHPLKDSIRAVINLEACGVGGPEIVFQATSEEMIRALARTPRPYGTVLASEIFATGLILSDTDFRQFAEYGNLTGLDMALVQNSFLYHTRLDLPEFIEPGALQHMGENTLALLEYLTSADTTMGNSPIAEKLPLAKTKDVVYFSGLGGKLFLVYTRKQATMIYGAMASVATIIVADRVDWSRKSVYFAGAIGVGGSFLAAIVGANAAAAVASLVMGKTMTWFKNEAFPILLFAPPALLSITLFQRFLSSLTRTTFATPALVAAESSLLEHATLVGQLIHYTALLLVGHAAGVGSSYLFAIAVVASIAALGVNDYVLRPKGRRVHLATYVVLQLAPLLLGVEGLVGFLDLFVPLTGRLGADAPVDFIIASLTAGVGFLAVPMVLPFVHRFGPKTTSRIALFFTFFTAGTLGWFTRPSWSPYDKMHPKRILCLHMENISATPPQFDLHLAGLDSVPFEELVMSATKGLTASNTVPEPVQVDDDNSDWNIIFPVSQFLTTYKVPLPPTEATYSSPFTETFTVRATRDVLNSIKRTRSLDIELKHPGLIWPVIAFNGDVVSWDLPQPPERGDIRHHVKSVGGYGVNLFTLSLTLELSPLAFEAAVRESQRAKKQRSDVSLEDQQLAKLRIDYSALDSTGMYPASMRYEGIMEKPGMKFFGQFEKQLPGNVDAMLLSAVAGVAYV